MNALIPLGRSRTGALCSAGSRRAWPRGTWLRAALLLTFLLLAGCAVRPPVLEEAAPEAWDAHQAAVQALEQWSLSGRIALDADGQQWHANVRWKERNGDYDIQFFGPFGRDAGRLRGDETGVNLRTPDGEYYNAPDPDRLVRDVLGYRLPVSGLRHWVLGLPAPGSGSERSFDARGRLSLLEQSGWQVQYQRYRESVSPTLPDRLELHYGQEIRLRLLVDTWALEPVSAAQ
ncbi:lipoprotein insertase outer membrane protein LolB [Thioalkalivibrio sulfidiphilus]|uniref:Outer-membrane lipoprotein LolB n=1 Tax=Thioalkalivibrio sulfidiphilus (strain HL-EbGR7) TaxID=396588 RepID=B8GLA4_THISH|nr:lipoprotein insertase outer membrane protein LolB [Thioalkalivibrio sulfidiphilus]ACL71622.1 outer membrane lipoprotein LolB [Thioalkalivibrio sulfidiphilus HL-EbGr7]